MYITYLVDPFLFECFTIVIRTQNSIKIRKPRRAISQIAKLITKTCKNKQQKR